MPGRGHHGRGSRGHGRVHSAERGIQVRVAARRTGGLAWSADSLGRVDQAHPVGVWACRMRGTNVDYGTYELY